MKTVTTHHSRRLTNSNVQYFQNLDGWRFIAFFVVFMYHSFHTEYDHIRTADTYQIVNAFFSNGDLGVNFFFVLSGFLITYLLFKEEAESGNINLLHFYYRRILRIWPLYFFCVLFGFVLFPLFKQFFGLLPNETAEPALFLFFLSNLNNIWNGLPDASILGVLWSVSIEEQFYLVWPILIIILRKHRILLFVVVVIISLLFRYVHIAEPEVIYFHTLSVISDMAVGGILAWLTFFHKELVIQLSRIGKWQIALIYAIGVFLIIFRNDIFISSFGITVERLILSLFFAFIILEQNFFKNSIFKIGKNKMLSSLGKYTYGLYCLHFIGILFSTNLSKLIQTNDTLFGVLIWETFIAFTVTLILAWFSYHYYESFFLRFKKKFTLAKPQIQF